MAILFVFLILQLGDAGTTLLFLTRGVTEANPLIGSLLHASVHPTVVLMSTKIAACALAMIAWKGRRLTLLRRANVFFAVCVAWNLVAIATS